MPSPSPGPRRWKSSVGYLSIAAEVTGLEIDTVMKVARLDLAASALRAPWLRDYLTPSGG